MKTCTKCGEVKPLEEFTSDSDCKICRSKYQKKYYSENHEKIKEQLKKDRDKNPEKYNERKKKYRSENTEKVKYSEIKQNLKRQIGETPPPELVEIKVLINKTKRLCKTLKN